MRTSRIKGFYNLSIEERRKILKEFAELSEEEIKLFEKSLTTELADKMIENVIGVFPLPLGVAVNFLINNKDYLVPFAIEEPSVVAAASYMAKVTRENGGIKAEADEPIMIGQVHLAGVENFEKAKLKILENKQKLLEIANSQDPVLVKFGGGAKDIEIRVTQHEDGEKFLVVHLLVNCCDAMGANAVNTMVEAIAPILEELTQGEAILKIISNLAIYRKARASVKINPETIGGKEVVRKIVIASKMAEADSFRAATHNKGIMNGIDAVCIATGNDWRAVEAGAHAYACKQGKYKPLAIWRTDEQGNLVGKIELPIAVGIVGGATKVHPLAKLNLRILGVSSAKELACVLAAVGLVQNLAALRAIVTEGIQRGHMELHARNLAIMAGAKPEEATKVAELAVKLAKEKGRKISMDIVEEALKMLRK
ncbi:MAG TPA: hydroxymethylglutaryl-CoA reductase, degradative [Nanoarchaeota archaeon]|nr:hydroxymethylglutaryl-CoA reductase, degradative [Nanoarchaeota archaeon]